MLLHYTTSQRDFKQIFPCDKRLSNWQHQNYDIKRYDDMIPCLRSSFHLFDEMKTVLLYILRENWEASHQLIYLKGSHIGWKMLSNFATTKVSWSNSESLIQITRAGFGYTFWCYLLFCFHKVQFLLKIPKKCLKDLKRMNTIWVGITLHPRFQKIVEKKRREVVIGYGSK